MVRKNPITMKIHPSLRRAIKIESAKRDMKIKDFTKKLGNELPAMLENAKKKNKTFWNW